MKQKMITFITSVLMGIGAVSAQTYSNPVLPHVADAGCIRYAGKYYIGGVGTNGDFFVSNDLVDWNRRIHVFDLDNQWTHGTGAKNNQIHANDMTYCDGVFHFLFSANWWGKDRHIVHITHATASDVEGPYREVRDDQWMENRIDPMVFCDEDGRQYLYMVKFTDGNTIWGRPLNKDLSFAGDAVQQFSSQPGTWETMDNRVAEGPWAMKYRGRYYMMYNTNHTALEYGNYRLGVCEASSPLGFNPGGKYSHPVVEPNTVGIDDNHVDLLRYGSGSYVPVDWQKDTIRFVLSSKPEGDVFMLLMQQGTTISLNGVAVNPGAERNYELIRIDHQLLRVGENTLTVNRNNGRSRITNIALYDFGQDTADDVLVTPGQPNILRGPNGWEWWLVYMANKNGWSRDQYIDRVHFTRGRLVVDGITGPKTKGFHPAPAKPVYSGTALDSIAFTDAYLLELTVSSSLRRQGIKVGGREVVLPDTMRTDVAHEWRIEKNCGLLTVWIDRVLVADHIAVGTDRNEVEWLGDAGSYDIVYVSYCPGFDEYGKWFSGWGQHEATPAGLCLQPGDALKGDEAENYAFTVQLMNHTAQCRYGVYAAWKDEKNYIRAYVDAGKRMLVVETCRKGKMKTASYPLAKNEVCYPDIKYSDNFEKQYRFDVPTAISEISLYRHDADRHDVFLDDVASTQQFCYLDGDTWKPLAIKHETSDHSAWQRITFPEVRTKALRMINAGAQDEQRHIYRIKVKKNFSESYQLRIERQADKLYIHVDNEEKTVVDTGWLPPTRIGLYCDGQGEVTVKDILYYEKGK